MAEDSQRDGDDVHKVDTVPPPPGEDDAYHARTKVVPLDKELLDSIRPPSAPAAISLPRPAALPKLDVAERSPPPRVGEDREAAEAAEATDVIRLIDDDPEPQTAVRRGDDEDKEDNSPTLLHATNKSARRLRAPAAEAAVGAEAASTMPPPLAPPNVTPGAPSVPEHSTPNGVDAPMIGVAIAVVVGIAAMFFIAPSMAIGVAIAAAVVAIVLALRHDRRARAAAAAAATTAAAAAEAAAAAALPRIQYDEDGTMDFTELGSRGLVPGATSAVNTIVFDSDALPDEPTEPRPLILVTATGQSHAGVERDSNEDSLLVLPEQHVFVVADGMGGHRGGEIASHLAVEAIARAFRGEQFASIRPADLPRRAGELVQAVRMANRAVFEAAQNAAELSSMGTTLCAARFSPNKQRLYITHVGDSRVYRLRETTLERLTKDHTMHALGVRGFGAEHLSRAVGVAPTVDIDVVLAKPLVNDTYLLCSDGLNKMVPDDMLCELLARCTPEEAVQALIRTANARGGKDNITVIVIRVDPAKTIG